MKTTLLQRVLVLVFGILCVGVFQTGKAQTTSVQTTYLMTLYAPLEAQPIDNSLLIVNVLPGGWAKGPNINAEVVAPAGDWLRVMPGGSLRLDVRGTLKTDDGAFIYFTYNGIISMSKETYDRLMKGEVLTSQDMYFITAPTFQTSSEKYAYLNRVQAVGKVVEVQAGHHVKYDIFIAK